MKRAISTFTLLFAAAFCTLDLNAQSCQANKVWACRYDACGVQECKCVSANQVQSWTAAIPPCSWKWPHCCRYFRMGKDGSEGAQVFPNPVSASATISFALEQSQRVAIRILDLNGRLVSTVADQIFEQGTNELAWSTEEVSNGIYLLEFQSAEGKANLKLIITK